MNQDHHDFAEVASGFIHEIKNHVNTLHLNLQLLAEDFEEAQTPKERRSYERAQGLTEECRKIVDLSHDFLRFARTDELRLEATDLGELIMRMIDFLAPTARLLNIHMAWHTDPDLPKVLLDAEMFEKVLLNLMLNAQDAMAEGGQLTVLARSVDQEVLLEVIDTGCGIPAQTLPHIFRPFFTTKSGGHGLGLATVKKIVLAHQGRITVQSEPTRGTQFTIGLKPVSDNA